MPITVCSFLIGALFRIRKKQPGEAPAFETILKYESADFSGKIPPGGGFSDIIKYCIATFRTMEVLAEPYTLSLFAEGIPPLENCQNMETLSLVPAYPPLPFPMPVWLMQTLLILGFYLHALPMNVIWGGSMVSAVLFFIGRKDANSFCFKSAKALAVSLPLFISFAITQGIVPLLFLQLLYGPAFYVSSILMAASWLGLLGILLIAYYVAYYIIYRVLKNDTATNTSIKAATFMMVIFIAFAVIASLFTNNLTLMQTPEKWLPLYSANPHGMNLNSKEAQILPRYLHFFIASIAVAGMTLGCFGLYLRKRNEDFSKWLIKTGSRIFLGSTILQIPVGLWFLKAIPAQFAAAFMGADTLATVVFIVSMSFMLLAIVCTSISSGSGDAKAFMGGLIANALLILAMIVNRHQLRLMHLDPHVKPDLVAVSTQWDLLAIFLVSTVALIFYLIWLSRLVWSAYHPGPAQNVAST